MTDSNTKNTGLSSKWLIRFAWLLLTFIAPDCIGQIKYHALTIGDDISNTPAFKNLVNYPRGPLFLKNLKGKVIIIDFWSTGCPSCIEAIPHLEQLQKEFQGKIQIIMVDPWEAKSKVVERISKMRVLRPGIGLTTLPNAYGDTIWRTIFPHTSLPHNVWIDKEGKVIATTTIVNATVEHIKEVLEGKSVKLSVKNDLKARGYDERKEGLLLSGDTSIKLRFYSGFTKSNHGFGSGTKIHIDSANQLYKRTIFNESILQLFHTAYKNYPLILEVKDSSRYIRPHDPNKFDEWFRDNCYCYEITLPLKESDSFYNYMDNDLSRFFLLEKNIRAGLEKRKMPTIILRRREDYDFGRTKKIMDSLGYEKYYRFINTSLGSVMEYLKNSKDLKSYTFIDQTGLNDTPVSISVYKDLKDLEKLKSLFWQQGFKLSFTNQEQDVLVINDH